MPVRTSLIVVNFEGGPDAADNIAHLAEREMGPHDELLVVDSRSTDGSAELIEARAPAARLIRLDRNAGYATAVNRGLREAAGDAVVILNADVKPEPGAVSRLVDAARGGRFALVGGLVVDAEGRPDPNCARPLPRLSGILAEGVLFRAPSRIRDVRLDGDVAAVEVVSGSVMALCRRVLDLLGPLDENFFLYREDVEWCSRARSLGLSVGLATDARFVHEGGASTRQNEGPAFAARVLSDFHYFCDLKGAPVAAVRRRWFVRLAFRSFLYWADATFGVLGKRAGSRRRSAIYRILLENLRTFSWTSEGAQKCHPSRLARFPTRPRRAPGDVRPFVLVVVPDLGYGGAQRRVEYVTGGPLSEHYYFEALCLRRSGPLGKRIAWRLTIHEAGVESWLRPATWRRIRDYCALLEPDLVHSGTFPADVAAFIGFGRRVPRIVTKVSVDLWMTPLLRLVDAVVSRTARCVYCVADEVARVKSYLGRDGMLPAVIPNPPMIPVDERAPAPFPVGRPIRVAFIGRLAHVKRADFFLRTARALEDAYPGRFTFRVLGDGPERPSLEALADRLHLTDLVGFDGFAADISSALADIDIVPMFSRGEGSPQAVIETVARGRVPVVLQVGGARDVLPPELDECYVGRLDVDAYVRKIVDIAERSAHYLERVQAAKASLGARARFHDAALEGLYRGALGLDTRRGRVKVLHLITRLIVGGAQENTIASVERVDPTRFESHLWTGAETGPEGSLFADARARGIVVRVLPSLVREVSPLRDAQALAQLVRLMRRERFEIVHTHASKAGILGRIAARLAGVPHVTHTLHGWGFHDRMHPLLKNVYATAERALARWTSPLVSVSEKTTAFGLEHGIGSRGQYRLIRSGVPLEKFRPDADLRKRVREDLDIPAGDLVVGSVGRLTEQKNPIDFVRLGERLLGMGHSVTFLYVGDGPLRGPVTAAADSAGLGEKLRLLGVRKDVPDLLKAMDVFVLTSLWEGLPRVVLQALATGVPVVAYDTAGIGEAVREGVNGYLVQRDALDDMAARLHEMLADPDALARMGRRASEAFDPSFSEEKMITDLEELYGELLLRDA